jgi:hypothetical protein
MTKQTVTQKSPRSETTNDTFLYADTLATLDKIEIEMKRIVPALDQHTMEISDPRERAAVHHARGACVDWMNKFATVRRRASTAADCGEYLLPRSA